jgi:hypothetical protein
MTFFKIELAYDFKQTEYNVRLYTFTLKAFMKNYCKQ